MAYLTDREFDVFISYAHHDDGPTHWIRHFTKQLEEELKRQLRIVESLTEVDVTIWKDNQLPQQGNLSDRLQSVIKESSIFLVIMSESYLLSEWCKKEGIMFVNSLNAKSDLRIFIVEIEQTNQAKWPEFLKTKKGESLLFVKFYEDVDVAQTETIPMITPQGDANPQANRILKKVCKDLSGQLHKIKHFPRLRTESQAKNVFLAISPEGKARKHRAKLETLLGKWDNISTLPRPEPRTSKDFEKSLAEDLVHCDLFVQVLDELHGPYLTDWVTGFVGHQFDEALEKKKMILNWKDPTLNLDLIEEEEPYKQFLRDLRPQQEGGTIFEGTLEDLAQVIHDTLDQLKRPERTAATTAGTCFVAVKSDVQDQDFARDVGKVIKTEAAESNIPVTAICLQPQIKAWELDYVTAFSKGIVIIWGEVGVDWVLPEVDRFKQVAKQDDKVGAVVLCDPYPKSIELEGNIKTMNLSSQANPAQIKADFGNYLKELQQALLRG
jgi:hypothetical protein